MRYGRAVLLVLAGVLAVSAAWAVETGFWQVGTFDDLLQGKMQGVLLTKDGEIELAPESQTVFNPDETLALSLASDSRHNLYIGTGNQGKVYRVGPNMKGSLFFTAEEPDVFAMAGGPDGALYVATSPEGKIYRVTPDGKSKVFFDPKAKYIWALAFDKQGHLYAGTGDQGLIFEIDPDGKGKVFFDSHQTHIMCLTMDGSGNLLAGSVPDGLVYRIPANGKAFVIYKADYPEIHDLAVDTKGRIYAAALGAMGGHRVPIQLTPTQQTAPIRGGTTTVTVRASTGEVAAENDKTPRPAQTRRAGASFNRPAPATIGNLTPKVPTGRGALIRIDPDLSAETMWTSNKESIFGLALHGRQVLFTTDEDGRIFRLDPNDQGQNLTLLTETHESLATRLLFRGNDLFVATSNIAKLMSLGVANSREGTYESPVKDTKFVSKWGVMAWRATVPQGATLKFYARSGNSDRPDTTWSDWSGPYTDSDGSAIQCPSARYVQWKAVMQGSAAGSPVLDDVTVSYLNQNLPPTIQSLNVSSAGERTGPTGISATSASQISSGAAVTVTSGSAANPTPYQAYQSDQQTPTVISWQAQDPNGDRLTYSLYLKATDEDAWHLVKDKMHQRAYVLAANTLPDGKYQAKLIASDSESNPASLAREDSLESAPFWIDNTPPTVRVVNQTVTVNGAVIHFQATDDTSPLRSAEVSQDGKPWRDVKSDDGIIDSRSESFTVRVGNLGPGEHVLILRAFDTAGNAGLGKALIRVPGGK